MSVWFNPKTNELMIISRWARWMRPEFRDGYEPNFISKFQWVRIGVFE